ncbi:alcohol dehydrogenase catalytic domain-containing protein [Saccharomonospora sp. CUA-673]|uniref:alcohol dehydrogenase catalytic domain-containing protein n=1 Tax=Saccharomonospora sp. CUA-673 TaxID=1904969 RepID=UPI000ACCE9B3
MYAATVTRTDGPAALEILERPVPTPGDGEVLIDVKAAGVNFPDLLLTKNMYQYKPEPPFVLGGELAGVVREAPAGSGLSPGDRVAASTTTGAFAEQAVARVPMVLPLPDSIGFAAAACLPMNYLTMTFALLKRGGLQKGETVLVHAPRAASAPRPSSSPRRWAPTSSPWSPPTTRHGSSARSVPTRSCWPTGSRTSSRN